LRPSSLRIATGVSLFVLAAPGLWPRSGSSFTAFAQAQSAGAQLVPAKVTLPTDSRPKPSLPQPAAGTEIYTAKRGESIPTIAHHYLGKTSYLTSSELADAIRRANNKTDKSNILKANEQLIIPGILPAPIVEKSIPVAKDFEVRAIYLTGVMAASDHGLAIIKHWREVGGNAVVFDIKDSDGSVNIPFEHPLLGEHHVYIRDVPKLVRFLHRQNMHVIARIAIFRDEHLVTTHPELAVQSKKNHAAWRENGKLVWTDSSNPKVQDYNIALAKHVAELGADEIQFDYVRFPAEGDQKDASFFFQTENPKWQRSDVITNFLKKAYAEIHPTGALLSLDVFGVMAWQRQVDLSHTGQDIVGMARYCDVLSPMIYPSHFFGMDNIAHPGDEPAHFIGESMDRFELITKGSGVTIRPWLQAFHWRTKTYSPEYIKIQVETARAKGGIGFLFWNAANDYSKPYIAMPEMKTENFKADASAKAASGAKNGEEKDRAQDNPRYFRGDELPVPTVQAALTK
jgi:hypothetical protein